MSWRRATRTGALLLALLAVTAPAIMIASARAATPAHPLCPTRSPVAGEAGSRDTDLCLVIEADRGAPGEPRALDPDQSSAAALAGRLAAADIVLLGEVHDNAHHHRLRAGLLLALEAANRGRGGRPIAVVAEHVRSDQALALAGFRALDRRQRRDTGALFAALDWDRSGWPDAGIFAPLFDAVLELELPLLAGNVPRAVIRSVAREGLAVLDAAERDRVGADSALAPELQDALLAELEGSHCGLLPKTAFATMADAQRYRDAHMARALLDAAAAHGHAVLLAGNGHVRTDRGVPWHLARMAPAARSATVLFAELAPERTSIAQYLTRDPAGHPAADLVVLTPRTERPDPCEEMRKRFRR